MRRILLFVVALMAIIPVTRAQEKKTAKKTANTAKTTSEKVAKETKNEIHWITSFDELQQKMKENPKKVYVDVYTDWCGWCKKMEATTFQNPDLIKYMNLNYYAVRFNAERQDAIQFNGKEYPYSPQYKANMLAVELMQGKMGFPTSVIMLENFQNPIPLGGYLTVPQLETVLTYYGDNAFKHQAGDAYQKSYKPTWDHGIASDITAPAGH